MLGTDQVPWEAAAAAAWAVVVFAGGYILNGVTNRLNLHSKRIDEHAERITRTEERYAAIDAKLDRICSRLPER